MRIRTLKPLAIGCSQRELCILAVAVEDLQVNKGINAMTTLAVIQVETLMEYSSKNADIKQK